MLTQTYGLAKILLLTVCVSLSFGDAFTLPIHSTNQYINQLLFYRPYTNTALIKKERRYNVDISQSNIFQKSSNLEADFGLTTLDMSFFYPLSKRLELSFDYPLYYVSSGFLDEPLDFVHTTLDITTTRENEGHIDNQLHFRVTDKINKTSPYFASGNPQIELKYALFEANGFTIASNCGLKIPLGKKSDGFTNEKFDFMFGVELQKSYERLSWVLNAVVTKNGDIKLASDIISEDIRYFVSMANRFPIRYILPFDVLSTTDFLFTYQYSSAPYESSDEKFNSYTHLLQFAIRSYLSDGMYVDIFFNQNTIPRDNEADVTFGLSYNFKGL